MIRHYQDVRRLLSHFGCLIYMGNRLYDIEMAMIEIRRLYEAGVLSKVDLLSAVALLEEEREKELRYQKRKEKEILD